MGVEGIEVRTRLWSDRKKEVSFPPVVFLQKVEAERLSKRYHQRWHGGHGRSCAILRAVEMEGTGGLLCPQRAAACRNASLARSMPVVICPKSWSS